MSLRIFGAVCCVLNLLFSYGPSAVKLAPVRNAQAVSMNVNLGLSKLRKPDRARLAEAYAGGRKEIGVLIAAFPGSTGLVAAEISRRGGKIRYRADDVSYLRARVSLEQVIDISRLNAVQAINIDGGPFYDAIASGEIETEKKTAVKETSPKSKFLPPGRHTPSENSYLPTREMGAPQFVTANPTFDGRGAAIAIIDTFPDVLATELQSGTSLDGKPVRKFVDILSAIDPIDDESPALLKMQDRVEAVDGQFGYQGSTLKAPRDGKYYIALLDERSMGYYNRDLNLDGNPPNSSGIFAVLWDENTNTVWVDTNQNLDFSDEKSMTDYGVNYDIDVFGKDKPAASLRKSIAFTVMTFPRDKRVAICLMATRHGTAVAGVAVGRHFFEGDMNGVAPEAQVVAVSPSSSDAHGFVEACIIAARHPRVDVITMEHGFELPLNDGNSVPAIVCDRLIEKYNKPIFSSASNTGPGLNTVSENGSASRMISVGAYTHQSTWQSIYGRVVPKEHYVDLYSSRGPREDGGFKPDLVAIGSVITLKPRIFPSESLTDAYELPPGYTAVNGTSFSAPAAAGAAALLISAAKQSNVKYDAERLKWALKSSAKFLPGIDAYEQGAGLVNIPAAWEALKKTSPIVKITSNTTVNTILSSYLKQPNQGPGIYDREGWSAGQIKQKFITLIRETGSTELLDYKVRWTGNDDTFESPDSISLPLNTPVEFPVTIHPRTIGVHSAILSLDDYGEHQKAVYQIMNTIVVAAQLTNDSRFVISLDGAVDWLGHTSFFINVPPNAPALRLEMNIIGGTVEPSLLDPAGVDSVSYRPRPPDASIVGYEKVSEFWSRTLETPMPGVWQLLVTRKDKYDRNTVVSPKPPVSISLKAKLLGVTTTLLSSVEMSNQNDLSDTVEIEFRNGLGDFHGSIINSPLGNAFNDVPVLVANGPQQIYDIYVEPGSKVLRAFISDPTDIAADIDLYLFDCTGSIPILRDFSTGNASTESVAINDPPAGRWKVIIDPFRIPAGRAIIRYLDVYTNAKYGLVKGKNGAAEHVNGQRWNEPAVIVIGGVPSSNRHLVGLIEVSGAVEDIVGYNLVLPDSSRFGPDMKIKHIRRHVPFGIAFTRIE